MTEAVLADLAVTPQRLAELGDGLPETALQSRPAPDAWSARDVLAHLRACADVWGGAIGRILDEDRPTFRAISPRTWIDRTDYPDLPFHPCLQAFSVQRRALLDLLRPRSPEQWAREATVTGAGRPLHPTVLSYAQRLASHERGHLRQVARLVSPAARG